MTTNRVEDQLPDDTAPYGVVLGYWLKVMALTDGQLARAIGVDRSYPGKVRRGGKLPSPETAAKILEELLKKAEQPGWNGTPVLTVSDRQTMEGLLRSSHARDLTGRRRTGPLPAATSAEVGGATTIAASPAEVGGGAIELDRLLAALAQLQGAAALEALIMMTGDDAKADEMVRSRVQGSRLFTLGKIDDQGLAHLLHCTVPAGTMEIPMLPVFTRMEHLRRAVGVNVSWSELQPVEVEGKVLLGDLDPFGDEFLGINPWSGHDFKLPTRPSSPEAR